MENIEKLKSGVFIELGGEDRKLEYTMHSVVQYRLLTGKNLFKGEVSTEDPAEITALVWAGLITSDESFDGEIDAEGKADANVKKALRQIGKWITLSRLPEIGEAFQAAFNQAQPAKKKS